MGELALGGSHPLVGGPRPGGLALDGRLAGADLEQPELLGGQRGLVEKTMIGLRRTTIVQATRNAFQTAMRHKFIAAVERISGRTVLAFISSHHVGADIEIESFMLARGATSKLSVA